MYIPSVPPTTLVVGNGSSLVDWGVINSSGTIIVDGVLSTGGNGFLNNVGGSLFNHGTLYISGDIGTINNLDGGFIMNSGLLSNLGKLNNGAGSTITNEANGTLDSLLSLVNEGTLVNHGFMDNKLKITNQGADGSLAIFENYGTIFNAALLEEGNQSLLENFAGGNITNAASLINKALLENNGNLDNPGVITNNDAIITMGQ